MPCRYPPVAGRFSRSNSKRACAALDVQRGSLDGLFDVYAPEPLTVKGVDQPIASYLLTKAKPRSSHIAARGIEGVATRIIGHESELEALQVAFKRLFVEPQLQAISAVAEAGSGKSRVLNLLTC